jgi:hypothetical protein
MALENIKAADLDEVALDQFAYLAEHASACAIEGCPDCRRYYDIRSILLAPFARAIGT